MTESEPPHKDGDHNTNTNTKEEAAPFFLLKYISYMDYVNTKYNYLQHGLILQLRLLLLKRYCLLLIEPQ